jgi:hypothetical protein
VTHAGGTSSSPTCLVNFLLPNGVGIIGVFVTQFVTDPDFDAIIGMDIITLGDFSVTNVMGKTWMSFRTPSCVAIDYVAEANRIIFAGVGRNEPCPCGKKKETGQRIKFKYCHGA